MLMLPRRLVFLLFVFLPRNFTEEFVRLTGASLSKDTLVVMLPDVAIDARGNLDLSRVFFELRLAAGVDPSVAAASSSSAGFPSQQQQQQMLVGLSPEAAAAQRMQQASLPTGASTTAAAAAAAQDPWLASAAAGGPGSVGDPAAEQRVREIVALRERERQLRDAQVALLYRLPVACPCFVFLLVLLYTLCVCFLVFVALCTLWLDLHANFWQCLP